MFLVTSRPPTRAGRRDLRAWSRGHWSMEARPDGPFSLLMEGLITATKEALREAISFEMAEAWRSGAA